MRTLKLCKYNIIILLFFTIVICSCGRSEEIYLNSPIANYYVDNYIARCVWDMQIFNNKLYIGCGDYNNNSGPTPIIYYDFKTSRWITETEIPDEQIGRFIIINDKLTIPGFDPIGLPEKGTYYQYNGNSWETISGLLDGLHNFDLIKYDNMLFAGIGALRGLTPIIVSKNGIDFERVPMIKNNKSIITTGGECIRVHNFFFLKNELYAQYWFENTEENKLISEIYKYNNGKFEFYNDLIGELNTGESCKNLPPIFAKEVINDTVFLTTGFLYTTTDMKDFSMVSTPSYARTYDIYKYDSKLYFVTASETEDNRYKIIIYSTKGEANDFKTEKCLESSMHPTSLAVNENYYFIALGDWWNDGDENNGKIIQVVRHK